ncbi:ABC transporter substrate-binding protein [Paenibacillus ginsengarvi]|uniref:ABC transporter substrate-binding protein n=1 Tax=Paenibacillus ginsengarvi TaxID=400777 RepID=UPI00187432AA|nr:extracellular solute-binding protein [Paenibacillus ginsengarvi]
MNEQYAITVMYYSDQSFIDKYGKYFMKKFPTIKLIMIPYPAVRVNEDIVAIMSEYVKQHNPDILFLPNYGVYRDFARSGKLTALDEWITIDRYPLEDYHQGVLDVLRSADERSIYGLSPTFTSRVLFYNKELFDSNNIPYPSNHMTWMELFKLASVFKQGKGLELESNKSYDLLKELGTRQGLTMLNNNGTSARLNTPEWKGVWETAATAYRYQNLQTNNPNGQPSFLKGTSAMFLANSYNMENIPSSISWGVVTEPIDSNREKSSYSLYLDGIFAVHSQADERNKLAAWEFIKYINSEEMASILLEERPNTPTSRKNSFMQYNNKEKASALYGLTSWTRPVLEKVPQRFFNSLETIAVEKLDGVITGSVSIEDALMDLQTEAEKILSEK